MAVAGAVGLAFVLSQALGPRAAAGSDAAEGFVDILAWPGYIERGDGDIQTRHVIFVLKRLDQCGYSVFNLGGCRSDFSQGIGDA